MHPLASPVTPRGMLHAADVDRGRTWRWFPKVTLDKIKGLSAGGDAAALAKLRTEEAEIRTRLKMSAAKLRVERPNAHLVCIGRAKPNGPADRRLDEPAAGAAGGPAPWRCWRRAARR